MTTQETENTITNGVKLTINRDCCVCVCVCVCVQSISDGTLLSYNTPTSCLVNNQSNQTLSSG